MSEALDQALRPLRKALGFAARGAFANADRVGGLEALAEGCLKAAAEAGMETAKVERARGLAAGLDGKHGEVRREAMAALLEALGPESSPQPPPPPQHPPQHPPKPTPKPTPKPAGRVAAKPPARPPSGDVRSLDDGLRGLPGIGPSRAEKLAERGLSTIRDLLHHLPLGYQSCLGSVPIGELEAGSRATVVGEVERAGVRFYRRGRGFEAVVGDGSGRITVRWFRGAKWIEEKLKVGQRVALAGEVRLPGKGRTGRPEMAHPEILDPESLGGDSAAEDERLQPRYSEVPGIPARTLRLAIEAALPSLARLEDPLPPALKARRGLPELADALRALHQPPVDADLSALAEAKTPAHGRLIYDEFLHLQLGLAQKARGLQQEPGQAQVIPDERVEEARRLPPFQLTGAQERVLGEVVADLRRPQPMHRLLQGDVGSGKTVVAGLALWLSVRAGHQGALMAPTELLAEQHGRSLRALLEPAGITVVMLTGQLAAPARREALAAIASGEAQVVVGTHALIQPDVTFRDLATLVVDEQHRFGVAQRRALMEKGQRPDVLVMTATPIPRTLAMTAYGDLDLSILDELPPGRTPVATKVYRAKRIDEVWEVVREQVAQGRQAYVVYPLVETSVALEEVQAATERREHLAAEVFPELQIGLLHGRMAPAEKDAVMAVFSAGRTQILVATTVIEVGIDVPNATVMVVEHAERFGLSQLHQLRGRVGRGAKQSHCLLVAHPQQGQKTRERLAVMERTTDGFVIAEEDLRIRGPGDLLGTRQSGHPDLVYGNLVRDRLILSQARDDAFALIEADPELERAEHRGLKAELERRWHGRLSLGRVG
ncbi:MAG: ATP-dependent DNA helicase RecG [Deltaproteobacteria bacterium]|nr:ATP-dependent DNA helicase RecG [Deltaproteobacteria bacterium]